MNLTFADLSDNLLSSMFLCFARFKFDLQKSNFRICKLFIFKKHNLSYSVNIYRLYQMYKSTTPWNGIIIPSL